jgi:anti-sigma B factor antagonist
MTLGDLKISIQGNVVVARLSGEIDLSNSGELRTAITDATPNEVLGVVLDLSAVDYIDSAGIQLLYRLREGLRVRGQALRLVIPSDSLVNDTLRLAGIERNVEMVEAIDEGIQALASATD